jgi:hypothetical protein
MIESVDLNKNLFDTLQILGTDTIHDVREKWKKIPKTDKDSLKTAYDKLIGLRTFKGSKYYLLYYR